MGNKVEETNINGDDGLIFPNGRFVKKGTKVFKKDFVPEMDRNMTKEELNLMRKHNLSQLDSKRAAIVGAKKKGYVSPYKALGTLLQQTILHKNPFTKEKENLLISEHLSLSLLHQALRGNIKAISEVFDRVEGKSVQRVVTQSYKATSKSEKLEMLRTVAESQGLELETLAQIEGIKLDELK